MGRPLASMSFFPKPKLSEVALVFDNYILKISCLMNSVYVSIQRELI